MHTNVLMVGGAKSVTINTLKSLMQQSTKYGHYYFDESNQLNNNNKFLLLVFGDGMTFMENLYLYSFESICAVSNYSLPRKYIYLGITSIFRFNKYYFLFVSDELMVATIKIMPCFVVMAKYLQHRMGSKWSTINYKDLEASSKPFFTLNPNLDIDTSNLSTAF